jgi:hypothetical protein
MGAVSSESSIRDGLLSKPSVYGTLKAARDFGLDKRAVNAVAFRFDPREPDVGGVADALAAALLRHKTLVSPDPV